MTDGISLYIHIPFCKSKCIYCDFFSKADCMPLLDEYVKALKKEILFYSKKIKRTVNTIYIGGGTPSLLNTEQLSEIISELQKDFHFNKDNFEFTIELNPDDVTEKLVSFLESSPVTRISLGIQSLKDDTLKLIKRRASREVCLNALAIIHKNFTKRFSVDLISGLPGEDIKDLYNSIDGVIKFNPEHISCYSLCVEENTELYKCIENEKIKFDFDLNDKLWIECVDYLKKKGYYQYEVSNFSKDKKSQSIHNLCYWHLNDYLGFGCGATGTIFCYEKNSIRYTNKTDIKKYVSFWNSYNGSDEILSEIFPVDVEILDRETQEFEFFMMNFRLREGVSKKEFEERFSKKMEDVPVMKNGIFNSWQKKNLSEVIHSDGDDFYRLTEKGIFFLNSFLENFA